MPGLQDYESALRVRDSLQRLINSRVEEVRPRYRYATVSEIDYVNSRCEVQYPGEDNTVSVRMGSAQVFKVGQIVRVDGLQGDRYISDIVSGYVRIAPEPWKNLALQNNWVSFGTVYPPFPRYFKDSTGVVRLHGIIKSGISIANTVIANVPVGYRPAYNRVYGVLGANENNTYRIDVASNGNIILASNTTPGPAWLSLDQISWLAEL